MSGHHLPAFPRRLRRAVFSPRGFREPGSLIRRREAVDDLIQVPIDDLVDPVQGQVDAVVRDPSLREVVGSDLLAAVSGPDLAPALLRLRVMSLHDLLLIEDRTQDPDRLILVFQLALLILA